MTLPYALDLIGTFFFAVTGALAAGGRKFDLFGIVFTGFLTAVGGGTVRDLLIGNHPVFWMTDPAYLLVIVAAAALTFFLARRGVEPVTGLAVADAIGLGVFTVIGIRVALAAGLSPLMAALMGMVTGVMGGVFRDLVCGRVPLILQKEIYATACLLGGGLYFILKWRGLTDDLLLVTCALAVMVIRLASMKLKLSLPRITRDRA